MWRSNTRECHLATSSSVINRSSRFPIIGEIKMYPLGGWWLLRCVAWTASRMVSSDFPHLLDIVYSKGGYSIRLKSPASVDWHGLPGFIGHTRLRGWMPSRLRDAPWGMYDVHDAAAILDAYEVVSSNIPYTACYYAGRHRTSHIALHLLTRHSQRKEFSFLDFHDSITR